MSSRCRHRQLGPCRCERPADTKNQGCRRQSLVKSVSAAVQAALFPDDSWPRCDVTSLFVWISSRDLFVLILIDRFSVLVFVSTCCSLPPMQVMRTAQLGLGPAATLEQGVTLAPLQQHLVAASAARVAVFDVRSPIIGPRQLFEDTTYAMSAALRLKVVFLFEFKVRETSRPSRSARAWGLSL